MKNLLKIFLVPALLSTIPGCNQPTNEDQTEKEAKEINEDIVGDVNDEDAKFIVDAFTYSLMLREYGQVAVDKSDVPDKVKEFAKSSVKFNEEIDHQLTKMTLGTKVVLPSEPGDNIVKFREDLKAKEAKDMAEDYMDAVDEAQSKMVSDYQHTYDRTKNSELRDWIEFVLPQIRDRENLVDQLEGYTDDVE